VGPDTGGASAEWRPGAGVSSVSERTAEAGGSLRALPTPTGGLVEPRLPLQLYI
jgi:two-component system NarL family sensor kinase